MDDILKYYMEEKKVIPGEVDPHEDEEEGMETDEEFDEDDEEDEDEEDETEGGKVKE